MDPGRGQIIQSACLLFFVFFFAVIDVNFTSSLRPDSKRSWKGEQNPQEVVRFLFVF